MKLALGASKLDALKLQLLALLQLEKVDIILTATICTGITMFNLDESAVSTLRSIRNIEAILLDEVAATKLL